MLTFIIVVIACVGAMLMFIKLVEDDSDSDRRSFESAPKFYRLTATPESRPSFNEWAQKLPKPKEYND